jgi:collagenase-like PrtC family protease
MSKLDIVVYSTENYDEKIIAENIKYFNESFKDKKFYLDTPVICVKDDIDSLKKIITENKITGIAANNYYAAQLAFELNIKYFAGRELNIFNEYTALSHLNNNAENILLSSELSIDEALTLSKRISIRPYVYAFGDITVMHLKHCPAKLLLNSSCGQCKYIEGITYRDGLSHSFKLKRIKNKTCHFKLLNCNKLNILKRISPEKLKQFNLFYNFSDMSAAEVISVLNGQFGNGGYTAGNAVKGVN